MDKEEKKYSILDELDKSSGFDIALMTTFNFEIDFFERAVLSRLFSNDVRKVSVFVDYRQFTKALKDIEVSYIGRKYMVNPVMIKGAYHPKIILLLGEKKARLFVGSANIKTSGYSINNEIFNYVDYSPEHPEYRDVIVDAIDFFDVMNNESYQLDNELIKEAKNYLYYHKASNNGEIKFLHSMEVSILSQIKELISEDIKTIKIAVPYYDNELSGCKKLQSAFDTADIHLYIQNEKSTFPSGYNSDMRIVEHICIFDGFKDNKKESSNNFYHGKVFLFKGSTKSFILYGSSNCTKSALVEPYVNGGNIECDLFEVGALDEFDYFFDNIRTLEDDVTLKCNLMTYETDSPASIMFKYGTAQGEIILHFVRIKKKKEVEFYFGDTLLKHEWTDDEILAYIPEELSSGLEGVFTINIHIDKEIEECRCWTYSMLHLENNRIKQSDRRLLDGFDPEADDDKYISDRYNILKAEMMCLPELREHRIKTAAYNQIKMEQEGDDTQGVDFIVDVQIPDEYREEYRQFETVSNIRNLFVNRFIQGNRSLLQLTAEDMGKVKGEKNTSAELSRPRKATSSEKSFERFVKNRVKGLFNNSYIEIIELEHYIGIVAVILEIFNKYNHVENVIDIFETEYVVKTQMRLFIAILIKMRREDCKEDLRLAILEYCYKIIIENYRFRIMEKDVDKRGIFDSANKTLLCYVEKDYGIRDVYMEQIKRIMEKEGTSVTDNELQPFEMYIEYLFGYKSKKMLFDFVSNVFGVSEIEIKGSTIRITAIEEELKTCLRQPDTRLLREIANYSRNVEPLEYIVISLNVLNPKKENPNPIVEIRHDIQLSNHCWRRNHIRKNGETDSDKPECIRF